jgi:3-oxoacyl-[acyl-carrier protein] reductase
MEQMLADKVAIITGSGRGIGRAAALLFAREGAKVVVSDIDAVPAEEIVTEIKASGGQAASYAGDVTSPAFADGVMKETVDRWGGIHIIVNNAGFTWDAVIHKMTDDQWQTMMDIHVTAPFRMIRAAAPYFRDAAKKEMAGGTAVARKIINISSMAGTGGNPGQANYAAAKSAILGLTKTLAKEWGRFNVQANSVAYGWIDTRLTKKKEAGEVLDRDGKQIPIGIPDAMRQMMTMMIPLGRAGTPEEAAGPLLFLASPLSDYVSGQVLLVTGGLVL